MNLDYKDILPISGTVLKRGTFTLNGCGSVCISDEFCQTIFYQPLAGNCFLYNYSIGVHTPIKSENGTEIYEIYSSCSDSQFVHNRAGGHCFNVFQTSNITSMYAMEACRQTNGVLIALDTNQRIAFVTEYIRNHFYFTTTTRRTFQIGLNNTQVPGHKVWKWSSGVNLTNDLLMPFSLNNFDGNMRDCSVGHCGVFEVKADYVGVFDNCCSIVSFWCICSRYVRQN
eukprot:XP_019923245.1 PREDICTED: uncharacterized protein LOC105329423 [Crassostrea gigas]